MRARLQSRFVSSHRRPAAILRDRLFLRVWRPKLQKLRSSLHYKFCIIVTKNVNLWPESLNILFFVSLILLVLTTLLQKQGCMFGLHVVNIFCLFYNFILRPSTLSSLQFTSKRVCGHCARPQLLYARDCTTRRRRTPSVTSRQYARAQSSYAARARARACCGCVPRLFTSGARAHAAKGRERAPAIAPPQSQVGGARFSFAFPPPPPPSPLSRRSPSHVAAVVVVISGDRREARK